jgi:hypothetical protein
LLSRLPEPHFDGDGERLIFRKEARSPNIHYQLDPSSDFYYSKLIWWHVWCCFVEESRNSDRCTSRIRCSFRDEDRFPFFLRRS